MIESLRYLGNLSGWEGRGGSVPFSSSERERERERESELERERGRKRQDFLCSNRANSGLIRLMSKLFTYCFLSTLGSLRGEGPVDEPKIFRCSSHTCSTLHQYMAMVSPGP